MSAALAADTAATEAAGLPTLAIAGPRATITLNRPRQRNRIEPADLAELVRLADVVDANPDLRVLVITGTGPAFSAGAHLGAMSDSEAQAGARGLDFGDMVSRLERVRVPTIARLQGGVYGGATDLALSCDFRIGHTGIEMFMPAGRLGVHYYESGLRRYVSRLGLNTAKRMFLTAEKFDAAELLRVGYLTHLVAPEEFDGAVDALASRIAEMAPLAVQGMKQALNEIGHGALDTTALAQRIAACKASADLQEGLASFKEKRRPVFRGR
ncbi:MAG: enoyl-CoA hydratase/isomerase family protein [Acetobacteraceae bacterium]|nr:enoyl-CoA hydratase/isomerase family protein [Acetobacteraceae bacterium]